MDEVCGYLHNWFIVKPDGIRQGKFTISDGSIDAAGIKENQYFRIKGSVFNDGVWKHPAEGLTDETFVGEIWAMSVPPALVALLPEIDAWISKYGGVDSVNYSPFSSESFNNYSYSKRGSSAFGNNGSDGSPMTWQDAFASKLRRWRRLNDLV